MTQTELSKNNKAVREKKRAVYATASAYASRQQACGELERQSLSVKAPKRRGNRVINRTTS